MIDTIFREYDIRGKVGTEFIISEVYPLTQAIVYYFKQHKPSVKTVAVGMDARTTSPQIKDEVIRALTDSGLDVLFIGICPTPVLYFALYTQPVDAGIMITASHNPPEYNGLKLCLGKHSVWGLQVAEICDLYKQGAKLPASTQGSVTDQPLIPLYVEWLADHFKDLHAMQLSAVVDCGNGTAGTVMPLLVQAMGWHHVQLLYAEVDGTCPNHEADPVKEKNMQEVKQVLATTDIQVGIGFDGDVDRMAPMTKQGFLVPGDQLLALFSQQVLNEHPGAPIVVDIKSSAGLLDLLQEWGAQTVLSPSGHAIIKDQMRKHHALLGGELSCHFFFNDRYFGYDDGIYAALRVFEILIKTGKTLDELLAMFPKLYSTPEFRIPCNESDKKRIVEAVTALFAQRPDVAMITIDGVRARMEYGWGILRASNTQPELCLRFESDTQQGLQQVKEVFFNALKPYVDASRLKQLIGL
ncbi:MAG: phosphomannomutase/phosphoglucomutase [Candidatus Babeliales bacterium]